MNLKTMEEMYCPWRNGLCLGERCMACAVSEQIPEDINGEPCMICLRAEEAQAGSVWGLSIDGRKQQYGG
jgi:hypothetical protein